MQKTILPSLMILFLLSACKTETDLPANQVVEEIIFGNVYGACIGSCRQLYRLDVTAVYEDLDTNPTTPYENTPFSTTALAVEQYELAESLLNVPTDLLESNSKIEKQLIADFDFYLRIKTATTVKTWIWDEISKNAKSSWKTYFDQVEATTKELNK